MRSYSHQTVINSQIKWSKTILTIISKLDLYIENNFIVNLDVFIIQNDYNVIWSYIFKSYETQEVNELFIMKNID